jgi:hypothetical protein
MGEGLSVTMFLRALMVTLKPSSLQSLPNLAAEALSTGSHTMSPVVSSSFKLLLLLLLFYLGTIRHPHFSKS